MARLNTTLVLLALVAPLAVFAADSSLATLGLPTGLKVDLKYIVKGADTEAQSPCNYTDPCVPTLQSDEDPKQSDAVVISWSLNMSNPNTSNSANTGIALRGCYAPPSQTDRPWRKDKTVVNPSESNQCSVKITKDNLPFGNGTFVWKLPNDLPAAIYSVRAYTVCGQVDGNTQFCSWGTSKSFFQTLLWNTVPGWLVAVTVPLICMGPALLVLYGAGHYTKKAIKSRK